jgi:pimeloyl-ACP methyl ester carboxylesterase
MATWIRGHCEANGIRIHFIRTGGGKPPVVLLHGLSGSGASWTPVARILARDFDVVMPDARGHGGSSAPRDGYRYDELANDVIGLVHALELVRPVVVGHSMGGLTAAVVASRGTGLLRGVVLVDPTFLTPERQREVYASDVAEQHRRLLGLAKSDVAADIAARHPRRSAEIVELLAEARLRTQLVAFDVLAPPNPSYRDVVGAIDAPVLLVLGDAPVVSLEMAAELGLRTEQIRDAGHGVPFDQPERLAEVVATFVRELDGMLA